MDARFIDQNDQLNNDLASAIMALEKGKAVDLISKGADINTQVLGSVETLIPDRDLKTYGEEGNEYTTGPFSDTRPTSILGYALSTKRYSHIWCMSGKSGWLD